MFIYFAKRVLASLPTLIGVSLLCFCLVQLTPGGPVEQAMAALSAGGGEYSTGGRSAGITDEQRKSLIEYYGFDRPILERYFLWIYNLAKLNLGDSYHYEEPVWTLIKRALPVSITFGLFSFFITYVVCIPLGTF